MNPSERVRHIREISDELAREDWAIVDLTLKQFSLPWSDQWSGEKRSYIIQMLESASDTTLLDLAKHLGTASQLEPVMAPSFWSEDDPRVFISHVSDIKGKATAQRVALKSYGIVAFVAHEDIEPTRDWQDEIESALATMDALVALLSPGFNESKWCDQEVGVAIGRQVPIVPVRIDLDPYGLFGKYQALSAKGRTPIEIAPDIVSALMAKPHIGAKITTKLVEALRHSRSWDQSRRLIALIRKSRYVNRRHVDFMNEALRENVEVREAHSVRESIEALAAKHIV